MHWLLRFLFAQKDPTRSSIQRINAIRADLARRTDEELRSFAQSTTDRLDIIAAAACVAARVLGLEMFDVQLRGALALTEGRIAEMQTGEGKTLAAVPAVVWFARMSKGVHVMTVNDYLARRDAKWMGPIYDFFGLSVGFIQREMATAERQRAYRCDVTYATANEVGFDYLRDQLALHVADQVLRPFAAAVIDEADSILIDEARIPLVIAGGEANTESLPRRVDPVTRSFRRGVHYTVDEHGRHVALTDEGTRVAEQSFRCGNLFAEENLNLLCAIQDSIHAHALLRRDVDYLVKDGVIESVDEFKGRVIQDRRWPAGLHSAIEAKEGVALKKQGQVLGSITLQNLIALYPQVCGMTGTAATQAEEFSALSGLDVVVIPTNRPVIRVDHPDEIYDTREGKEDGVIEEISFVHTQGRPVLVGTTSVEESERLSVQLKAEGTAHHVLNARNEEEEAAIIARAGELGAVTISTNMAGRGTDIKLGPGVSELGGLHVIGTNKHESRRIDNQLRGRAGRQGDPGSSRFFVSLEDDLLVRYGADNPLLHRNPNAIQRVVEGQNLTIRQFLNKYESVLEAQRQIIQRSRQAILDGTTSCTSETEQLVRLTTIDDLWSEYLAAIADYRSGIHWVSWSGRDPLHEYLLTIDRMFHELQARIEKESVKRLKQAETNGVRPSQRGATWTYLTTDQPFGTVGDRFVQGTMKKAAQSRGWKTF
jgi:preprotein translocase subunit SecA